MNVNSIEALVQASNYGYDPFYVSKFLCGVYVVDKLSEKHVFLRRALEEWIIISLGLKPLEKVKIRVTVEKVEGGVEPK